MEAALFARMLSDKNFTNLRRMRHKYSEDAVVEMVSILRESFFKRLPISDFDGEPLAYLEGPLRLRSSASKLLLRARQGVFGLQAMEEEICSTLSIENIDSSRESIRRIFSGGAPREESENRVYGMKRAIDFIALGSDITEENIYKLYSMAIGDFLGDDEKFLPGNYYRHDSVYVVGDRVKHVGLRHSELPCRMRQLVLFAEGESEMDDLTKAAAIHYCVAYLHPYFDGNGRMARLMHIWYLLRRGYSSALFVPLSNHIDRSKKKYYDAFTLVLENAKFTGVLDITPFLSYFAENVYNKLAGTPPETGGTDIYKAALGEGRVTEKERNLWGFVLSAYGDGEFSTKRLERDFGNAAYATIRSFVLKFEELGLIKRQIYGSRVKYRVA